MRKNNKKRILITAGPVWVPIDDMRIMTNIFGGALGHEIAKEMSKSYADVVLFMGPGRIHFTGKEKFKVVKFKYYNEVFELLKKEIKSKKYSAVVHSAAIPDYVPIRKRKGKVKSGKRNFIIKFKPTTKIVDHFKKWDPDIFVVKFKLEVGKTKKQLIEKAFKSMAHSKADLMVANVLSGVKNNHEAYIIEKNKNITFIKGKDKIAKRLAKMLK